MNITAEEAATDAAQDAQDHYQEHLEASHAIIFPWFVETIGLVVFFIMARYFRVVPYTAVMFVIGTIMGIGAVRAGRDDTLSESILMWQRIDSEVLLLVFLPGLIFKDALNVNFHLVCFSGDA